MIQLIFTLVKLICIAYLIARALKWFFKVSIYKHRFGKYKNVAVNQKAHILYGDYDESNTNAARDLEFHINTIYTKPETDLLVNFKYHNPTIYLCSHRALKEFKALVPTKIDRADDEKVIYGKLYTHAFDKSRSTKGWLKRRHLFFKNGDLKAPQNLIPLMIDCLDNRINLWKEGEKLDFVKEFSEASLDIIIGVLFGDDFISQVENCQYRTPDGKVQTWSFKDTLKQVSDDIYVNGENLMTSLFPVVNTKNLVEPFKSDNSNILELYRVIQGYLVQSGRGDLFSFHFLNKKEKELREGITPHQFMNDLFSVIDAGYGTVFIVLASCLFHLKKNPSVMKKLMRELTNSVLKEENLIMDGLEEEVEARIINE